MIVKYAKVRVVKSPQRAHPTDAGIDLFAPNFTQEYATDLRLKNLEMNNDTEINEFCEIILLPGQSILIPSGLIFEIDYGCMALLLNKSGIAAKKHLLIGSQVIDTFYNGEVHIDLHNVGKEEVRISPCDKLVQMVIIPILIPDPQEFGKQEIYEHMIVDKVRGDGGFGSTDKKV